MGRLPVTAISLLLVDDHTIFRNGLRELISKWDEFNVIGDAANGQEAVELCRTLHPDIILMDVQMPVMGGVEATRQIRAEFPATTVVMLTMSEGEKYLFDALKQGARGYVLKDISAEQLRERLHEVMSGGVPFSGAIGAMMVAEINRQWSGAAGTRFEPLTEREIQILQLVAEGLSNEEMGERLFLSEHTVKKQLGALIQKLGLKNRVQAAMYAVRNGFVDFD
jgi:two-component system NarL family response regulator